MMIWCLITWLQVLRYVLFTYIVVIFYIYQTLSTLYVGRHLTNYNWYLLYFQLHACFYFCIFISKADYASIFLNTVSGCISSFAVIFRLWLDLHSLIVFRPTQLKMQELVSVHHHQVFLYFLYTVASADTLFYLRRLLLDCPRRRAIIVILASC